MNKVVLLTAGISLHAVRDYNGDILNEEILIIVNWMPFEMSYRRCLFNIRFPLELIDMMRRDGNIINEYAEKVARNFSEKATSLMEESIDRPSDVSDACDELEEIIIEGFKNFISEDNGMKWVHHFNSVKKQ